MQVFHFDFIVSHSHSGFYILTCIALGKTQLFNSVTVYLLILYICLHDFRLK